MKVYVRKREGRRAASCSAKTEKGDEEMLKFMRQNRKRTQECPYSSVRAAETRLSYIL